MRYIKWMIIITSLFTVCHSVHGSEKEGYKGSDLLNFCNDAIDVANNKFHAEEDKVFAYGWCMGFVIGIRETNNTFHSLYRSNSNKFLGFCEAGDVSNGQMVRILVKYLNDNPEKLHLYPGALAIEAFSNAFPCR